MGEMPTFRENRRSSRHGIEATAEVRFETSAAALAAVVRDVGRRGLFLKSSQLLPIGTTIQVMVIVEQPFARLMVDGVVARADDGANGQDAGLGVEITDASTVWDRFYDFLSKGA